ncbi:MAG: exosortase C-terminal domain/associated protein EpsI [Myxococcota bacterium]
MTRLRLVLVLAFVSLPLVAARVVDLRALAPHAWDARALPEQVAAHRLVREQPLDAEVESMLEPESYTMRLYADEHGSSVWLYFAIYSGTDTTGAHDPAVCYPAQGWDASAPEERPLELADGERMAVRAMGATLGGKEERVLYWFQPAARWPTFTPREQVQRILDGFAGHSQYGFVRLSTQVARPSAEERARADATLARVAAALAPAVRQAVTGVAAEAPARAAAHAPRLP